MKTIWKFTLLPPSGSGVFDVPKGGKFVNFAFQHGNPTLWFEVNSVAPTVRRAFEIVGTGFECPDGVHLLSVNITDGTTGKDWAFHLYETTNDLKKGAR